MTGRHPILLPRWAFALALGVWLMAAQQLALLHPLSHLGAVDQRQSHSHSHGEALTTDAAHVACSLCLACAAATALASGAAAGTQALSGATPVAVGTATRRLVARAPSTGHNRGPPAQA
jgi:hypothetical protein